MRTRREFLSASLLGTAVLNSRAAAQQTGKGVPAEAGKKIRLGVVGGGFGSTFHWHEHPRCEVAAVTDLHAVRRKALRDAYRCDYVYESLEEMLKRAQAL